ncbi:bifunctional tRNA (5-methylaminomethyl-2-thiouridine)(34)-methyltransferase MnmD/FAD-dependent 5-carboxymethylaminomethyl-2-thiouridine(34) oxidoreductase MnmC [Aurantivibrio infirmus]
MDSKNADDLPCFADIRWDENGQPISRTYEDVYFSRHDGLEESRFVFLTKNNLPQRWQEDMPQSCFTIGETGFGSGLNFIATWQLWNQQNTASKWLHFISIEKHPWKIHDLECASELWPELKLLYQKLIAVYPATAVRGFYNIVFPEHRVRLTLIIDDIQNALNQLLQSDHPLFQNATNHRGFDAWYLDGFAPSKNAGMWHSSAIEKISYLSSTNTTLATFSSASMVRKALEESGFKIKKCSGFGKKREMITAEFLGPSIDRKNIPQTALQTNSRRSTFEVPWFLAKQTEFNNNQIEKNELTVIIGAGLAGCQTAYALALRNRNVVLLERNSEIASAASGAAQGIVYGKLSTDDDGLAQLNLNSLLFAHGFYNQFWNSSEKIGSKCGVLQLAHDSKEQKLWKNLKTFYENRTEIFSFIDDKKSSEISGIDVAHNAISFPSLGWINPKTLCEQLTSHPNITVRTNCHVESLSLNDDIVGGWSLNDKDRNTIVNAQTVIIANAANAALFEQTKNLPLKAIRGQLSYLHKDLINKNIRSVLCGKGYIAPETPTIFGEHSQTLGATFTLHNHDKEICLDDHRENMRSIHQQNPSALPWASDNVQTAYSDTNFIQGMIDEQALSGYVDFRCSTPDYLPIVGPVPKHDEFIADFALLRKNSLASIPKAGNYWPGLYVNVGYGSRGLAYTPICAELLASQICGDILPLPRNLVKALHSARFIIRDLARNKI